MPLKVCLFLVLFIIQIIFFILEITENNQLNIIDWLIKYPRQTIIIVMKILFTQLIEQYSKENNSQQVISFFFQN